MAPVYLCQYGNRPMCCFCFLFFLLLIFFPLHRAVIPGCHVFINVIFACLQCRFHHTRLSVLYVKMIDACPIILKISPMEECQVYFEPPHIIPSIIYTIVSTHTVFWVLRKLQCELFAFTRVYGVPTNRAW